MDWHKSETKVKKWWVEILSKKAFHDRLRAQINGRLALSEYSFLSLLKPFSLV